MSAPITRELARAAADVLARTNDVSLAWPGDIRRTAVIDVLAAINGLRGSGWDRATAMEHVSVTLPGVGPGLDLLGQIPVVGPLLRMAAGELEHPCIYLSPAAATDGVELMAAMAHELAHVAQIRAGGLGWCLGYALPELRAGGEAPCYGLSMAVRHFLGGVPVEQARADAEAALAGYGLDAETLALAKGILASDAASIAAGEEPPEVDAVRGALVVCGWQP